MILLSLMQQTTRNDTNNTIQISGIGFAHYMGLIMSFPRDVDIYLVEWPHVAMQMADRVSPCLSVCLSARL